MFDIKPVDKTGRVDVLKLENIPIILNLRGLRKKAVFSILSGASREEPITIEKISAARELESILNEDLNTKSELKNIGASAPVWSSKLKPRSKPITHKGLGREIDFGEENEKLEKAFFEINKVVAVQYGESGIQNSAGITEQPTYSADLDFWLDSVKQANKKPILDSGSGAKKKKLFSLVAPVLRIGNLRRYKKYFSIVAVILVLVFAGNYAFNFKKEIVKEGNSAAQNLEEAKDKLANMDFAGASTSFTEAYKQFSQAGESLSFLGANVSSLLADLPGAGKLKSADNIIKIGKLVADAGFSMSQAMAAVSKTSLILNPSKLPGQSISTAIESLKNALTVSARNLKTAQSLFAEIDESVIPDDKKAGLLELKSKLPIFGKLVEDSLAYTKFLEDLIGMKSPRKYLFLFQNPAELRPTGGFLGSYGVISFEDGYLKDFLVDDVYNLDGQLKENIIPPLQMQHITPTWGMRDANWFIDFPSSAKKVLLFFKKESGYDVDGVITLSPNIIADILKITGPIEMPEYGLTLNSDNFITSIQNEVEYGGNRTQPKKVLVDMAPKLLSKLYSANSDQWLAIFNVLVASVDKKDILMYFKDLNLQSFAVDQGFSGRVENINSDYLMIDFANIKGSKTDTVTETSFEVTADFSDGGLKHKIFITRRHNGGSSQFGFYNKQNPAYVRILVPDGSEILSIKGNSNPSFKPLIDYSKSSFKKDEDLSKLEDSVFFDDKTGVSIYKESGKTGFAFWMIVDPGQTKTVELEYSVPLKFAKSDYELYIQKQPGLNVSNLELNVIKPADSEVLNSIPLLDEVGNNYVLSGKLDKDLDLKVQFK